MDQDNKILFEKTENSPKTPDTVVEKEKGVAPTIFLEKAETENKHSKFPDWDIVPPYQFINPRIKQK